MSCTKTTFATVLLLALLAVHARAEVVRTKDGQRLQGEVVDETLEEVVLRTRWGVLVVRKDAIEAIEGRPGEQAAPGAPKVEEPPLDLAKVRALRLRARRQAQLGKRDEALATYGELLALDPDDATAHLELGVLRARMGQPAEAVASLRRAILAGFADTERLRRDEDLAPLQNDAAFQQLMAQRRGLLVIAARRAPARLARELRARGARADYRAVTDDARRLVYVNGLDDAAFAALRAEVEAFVDAARRDLFREAPDGPLLIVLLAERDRGLSSEGASYDRATHTLTLAPPPFGKLARGPVARRELARALHAADQRAREQRHAPWLEEGLALALGAARLEGERLAPGPSAPDPAKLTAWAGLPALGRDALERSAGARAAARHLVEHLWRKDLLAGVYEQHGAAAEAAPLEAALGQPLAEAEAAWREALPSTPVELPFTGALTTATTRGLRVTYVQAESGAAKVGLLEGDVLTAVDGAPVRDEEALRDVLVARAPGDEVEVDLVRGEQPLRVRLTLGRRPAGPIGPLRDEAPYLGVAVEARSEGVVVRSVDAGSPAAKAGLQPGDRLVSLDGVDVESVRGWLRLLRQKEPGQRAALALERRGDRLAVEVELVKLGAD